MTQTPNEQHLSTQPVNAEHIIAEHQADTAKSVKFTLNGLTLFKYAILSQLPFFGDKFSPAELQAHVNALQAQYAKEVENGLRGRAANDNDMEKKIAA